MSYIVTSSFQHDLQPLITTYFGDLKSFPELWSKWYDVSDSTRAFEQFTIAGELGLAAKIQEGQQVYFDGTQEGNSHIVSHIEYGTGVVITQNAVDDAQSGEILKTKGEYLRNAMQKTLEVAAHAKLNNATSTSSPYTGGNAEALASTTHTSLAGNQSNVVTGNAPLSEAAIEQACIQVKQTLTNRGLKANVMPTMLVVPDALEFEAERILGSEQRVGTADNDLNALKSLGKLPGGYLVDTYLTSSTAWFIKTDAPEGLKFFWRRKMAVDSMNESDKRIAKFFSTMRFSTVHNDFRCIMYSAGA
jgi:hypothetical protein